jgi:hypothetical protein
MGFKEFSMVLIPISIAYRICVILISCDVSMLGFKDRYGLSTRWYFGIFFWLISPICIAMSRVASVVLFIFFKGSFYAILRLGSQRVPLFTLASLCVEKAWIFLIGARSLNERIDDLLHILKRILMLLYVIRHIIS